MAKQQSNSTVWVILGVIGVSVLLVWALIAVGGGGSGSTSTSGGGNGNFMYLEESSPVVTASLSTPGKNTVLWFSATWCTICKRMAPFVQAVVERHADELLITERDVDRETVLVNQYAVRGTPTWVLLDEHGDRLNQRAGFMSEAQFEAFITQEI